MGQPVITERGRIVLRRKFGEAEMSDARGITRARLLARFVNDLASKRFGGVVLGYEGVLRNVGGGGAGGPIGADAQHTMPLKEIGSELERLLRNGITVGIVSSAGRESVEPELQHTIRPEYWASTHVGYCNGGDIRTLDDDDDDGNGPAHHQEGADENLESFLQSTVSDRIIPEDRVVRSGHHQASIKNHDGMYGAVQIIRSAERAYASMPDGIKVLESAAGRLTDVLTHHTSKADLARRVGGMVPKDRHMLCIGCDGQWPGSDCELLTHRYSLSTNTVSATAASCWNLLPSGEYGEEGALTYLKSMNAKDGLLSVTMA